MSNLYKQSFKQNYTENVSLSIFNCGIQRCEGGYTWGPGIRDHYLIHMILKGKGSYCVSGKEYTLKQGDLFLAKPNQLITYTADQNDPWEYAWVGFNGACANRLVSQLPFWENAPVHHCANFDKVSFELLQIFENLIANAVRFSKSTIRIQIKADADTVCLCVSDDGRGFDGEELEMAKKPYYKGENTSADMHFGLGLYICNLLCEKHGGTCTLANGGDGGAVVTAQLKNYS